MAREIVSLLWVLFLALPNAVQAARELPVVNVAIVTDGTSERVASLRAMFLEEIRKVNRGEFEIQAPADLACAGLSTRCWPIRAPTWS